MSANPTPFTVPNFSSTEWMQLFLSGEHETLSHKFLEILDIFNQVQLNQLDSPSHQYINGFVKSFLTLFTEQKFTIHDNLATRFIASNHVLMNLTAISSFRTTDGFLTSVLEQPNNLIKLLTLLNPRCITKIQRTALFDTNAAAGSFWYAHYACAYYGALQNKVGYENLGEHFSFEHPALEIHEQFQESYFGSTYAGGNRDQIVKQIVNRSMRKRMADWPAIKNNPNPQKIALISGLWNPVTSVHRNYLEFIRSLKDDYHLTLITLPSGQQSDTSGFDCVLDVLAKPDGLDLAGILDNDFQMVIFADVGMIDVSVSLANLRIAPIQIAFLGHSVSTFGANIDYFISGAAVEIADNPQQNYSEKLVLLPSMGVIHNVPNYKFKNLKQPREDGKLIINGLFWTQKTNYPFVQTLRKILDLCTSPVVIRLFVGASLKRANDYIPYVRDMEEQLGAHRIEIMPNMAYENYMKLVEEGDVTLDSHHFGGCNTIADSLWCRVPTVTWNSDKWYGRIGSTMLDIAGLGDCTANTEEEFISKSVRMLNDADYRASIKARIIDTDLESTIFSKEDAKNFRKAVKLIMEKHGQFEGDGAIYIEA